MDEDKDRPAASPRPDGDPEVRAEADREAEGEASVPSPEIAPSSDPADGPGPAPAAGASHPRWDPPKRRGLGRRMLDGVSARDGSLHTGLRVAGLVCLAGGALSAVLLAIPPGAQETTAAVRAPRVIALQSVPVDRVPQQPAKVAAAEPALVYEGSEVLRDLDLRGSTSGFVRLVPEMPSALCDRLEAAGWSSKGWSRSPLGGIQECLADRRYGDDGRVSAFAVLRGRETLSELRIKLNVEDSGRRAEAARDIGGLVADAFDRWRWDGAEALGERIAALEPFEAVFVGTKVRLMREHGDDVERWNLILRFPTPPEPVETGEGKAKARTLSALQDIADLPLASDTAATGEAPAPSAR